MASYAILSQSPAPALYGNPARFMLAITNGSGGTVTVSSISIWATNVARQPTVSARTQNPTIGPNAVSSINDGSTLYVPVSATFYGQPAGGIPSAASENFLLFAQVMFTDGTTVAAVHLNVQLADPIWGLLPGSPPNPATVVSSLQFSNPANSGLHLMGWV